MILIKIKKEELSKEIFTFFIAFLFNGNFVRCVYNNRVNYQNIYSSDVKEKQNNKTNLEDIKSFFESKFNNFKKRLKINKIDFGSLLIGAFGVILILLLKSIASNILFIKQVFTSVLIFKHDFIDEITRFLFLRNHVDIMLGSSINCYFRKLPYNAIRLLSKLKKIS